MNIHFEPLIMTDTLADRMSAWYNDPEIGPFVHPNFQESEPVLFTPEEVRKQNAPRPDTYKYLILADDQPIGEFSITQSFYWMMGPKEGSAWISIDIGEKAYWGQGIAKITMAYIEAECRRKGFSRIELGVFENNLKAKALYEKMGYAYFGRNEHFTYTYGAWRADLRMQKYL